MEGLIQDILHKNRINEPVEKLSTHGIANEIYATENFIIRIPTDHPEAHSDAFTEAVAAPVAKLHGVKTPALIYFDDSYTLLNKTYSIWERVHGLTLGETENYLHYNNTWKEIGFELGKLHVNVKQCEDPKGFLDTPDRDYTKDMIIQILNNDSNRKSLYLLKLVENKYTDELFLYKKCFVHGDTNQFNFLCTESDKLLSIIDWGDSGWADPAIDFYMLPTEVLDKVLEGYSKIAKTNIDINFIYRIIMDKVWIGLEDSEDICTLEKKIMELESTLLKRL